MEDLTGRLFGTYRIRELIRRGGMASVFKASNAFGTFVAVKVLPREVSDDPQYARRFARETALLTSMRHPNIVEILDSGQSDGYTYLVMPLITGGTLSERLLRGKPLDPRVVLKIVDAIGASLEYVHSRGVIHRDLKPSNVLLDANGTCLLSDFGIARIIGATSSTTGFIGTIGYASPEQLKGDVIDRRTDVYSLGVIVYELLTGTPPFIADSQISILAKHLSDPVPSLRNRNAAVPEGAEKAVIRALSKRADDRQTTVKDLVNALYDAYGATAIGTAGAVIPAPPPPPAEMPTVKIDRTTVRNREIDPGERARLLAYLDEDGSCVSLWKLHNRHLAVNRQLDHVDYTVKGNTVFAEIVFAWNAGFPRLTVDDLLESIDASIHVEEWANASSISESLCRPGPMNFFIWAGQWGYAINYPVLADFLVSEKGKSWRRSYQGLVGTEIPDLREPEPGLERRWTLFLATMAGLQRVHVTCTEAFHEARHRDIVDETTHALAVIDAAHEERPGLYGALCEYAFKYHAMRGASLYALGDHAAAGTDLAKALDFDPECYESDEARGKLIEAMSRMRGRRDSP